MSKKKGRFLNALSTHEMSRIVSANAGLAPLHEMLIADGFTISAAARPFLRADRTVTLRFVWRKREPGLSLSVSRSLRVRL